MNHLLKKIKSIDKKYLAIFWAGTSSIVSKFSSLILQLVSIPILTQYLGKEKYGLLLIILSFTLFINISDLGLGMNLQLQLPKLIEEKKDREIITVFFSSVLIMTILSFTLLILFYFFLNGGYLDYLFKKKYLVEYKTVKIVFVCYCISLPFSMINRLYSVYLKTFISELFSSISFILTLLFIILLVKFKLSINYIAFVFQGTPMFMSVLSFIYFFIIKNELLKQKPILSFKQLKNTVKASIKYLLIPISIIFVNAPDSILIGKFLEYKDVTTYTLLLRLTNLLTFPIVLFINPLLPSINYAIAQENYKWMGKIFKQVFIFIIIACIFCTLILLLFGNAIIGYMIPSLSVSNSMLFCILIYINYTLIHSLISVIGNSSSFIGLFLKLLPWACILTLILKILFLFMFQKLQYIFLGTVLPIVAILHIPIVINYFKKNRSIEII